MRIIPQGILALAMMAAFFAITVLAGPAQARSFDDDFYMKPTPPSVAQDIPWTDKLGFNTTQASLGKRPIQVVLGQQLASDEIGVLPRDPFPSSKLKRPGGGDKLTLNTAKPLGHPFADEWDKRTHPSSARTLASDNHAIG